MFSRRHPYLFFVLLLTSIGATAMLGIIIVLIVGLKGIDLKDMSGEKVGVIRVTGMINDSEETVQNIKKFRKDDTIKAIVIRVDSPGGGVGPSQEIFREIRKTIPVKKVIASMGSIAASGGYYIAAGADGIVANPGTITGSIGVIMGYTTIHNLLNKIGLVPVVVKSGEYKDLASPVRDMRQDERKILEDFAKRIHDQFIQDVAEGRKLEDSKVQSLADGRIFTGEEAKELGLVDQIGNLEDAIEWAGRFGGIKGEIITVFPQKKKISLLEFIDVEGVKKLLSNLSGSGLKAGYLYSPGK